MFEGLLMLLSLSAVMAIASFLAGTLPLSFSLSQSRLRLISTLGMGVLVGTSLIVIIPEGVETLYSAGKVETAHGKRSLSSGSGIQWAVKDVPSLNLRDGVDTGAFNMPGPVIPGGVGNIGQLGGQDPPKTPTKPGEISIMSDEEGQKANESHDHDHEGSSPHAWVGVSLIAGFILMYLVDTLPQLSPSPSPNRSNIYSLSDLSSATPSSGAAAPAKGSFSTTLGLLIHAFADGIALGASSSMPGLSFVVFFAIMVHKAPAAFGLTTVLLRQGLSKRQARVHLAAFSLAAPAGAIVTWIVVGLLGGLSGYSSGESGMKWWTGLILLFSGGTFLYVAMHTMQDNDAMEEETHGSTNGYLGVNGSSHQHGPKKDWKLVGAAVVGMILPAITQIGHAH